MSEELSIIKVTGPGQVRQGDALILEMRKGGVVAATAKVILHEASEKEEVIFRKKKNHYAITGMVVGGTSWVSAMYVVRKQP